MSPPAPASNQHRDSPWALVGFGFGGRAIVAELGLAGFSLNVYDHEPAQIRDLRDRGGIDVSGRADRFVPVPLATTDPAEALAGVSTVLVCTWSYDHASVARTLAPHLGSDHLVVLVQGHFGGALEFRRVLKESGCSSDVTVAEMDHFPFFGHVSEGGATIALDEPRSQVNVATLPAARIDQVLPSLLVAFPMAQAASNVLHTGLADTSALLHVPGLLFNVNLVEGGSAYRYYLDTMYPSVVTFIEKVDGERLNLARALGVDLPSLRDWYRSVHKLEMPSLREMLLHMGSWTYRSAPAPNSFDCPYVNQDLAFTLVGWSNLGRWSGVAMPLADSMIDLMGVFTGKDYRKQYGGLGRLGLDEPGTFDRLMSLVETG